MLVPSLVEIGPEDENLKSLRQPHQQRRQRQQQRRQLRRRTPDKF